MLGGHIEDGESHEAALMREALEEGGFIIDRYRLFAVRKIASTRPMPHQQTGKTYPFPTSYMLYYWATTTADLSSFTGHEIFESACFTIDDIANLQTTDGTVIQEGWQAYTESLQASDGR